MTATAALLSADDEIALRAAIAAAVLGTPDGLEGALEDDPRAYLRLVEATRVAAEETSRLLREAIAGARAAGHSWDALGGLLGVSRQAAQQRFGGPAATAVPAAGQPARRILDGLTAFDEMAALARAGRAGWHAVDYGLLHHVVEASPWQWAHRRVIASVGPRRRRLERDGWELVGGARFPWAYYKRRLDLPAVTAP